jgi:hypothetical protein
VRVPSFSRLAILSAVRHRFDREEADQQMNNLAEEQIENTMRLNWHWSQPKWPASRMESVGMAKLMIVYRCFYCGEEIHGAPALAVLHQQLFHPGKKSAITMYPMGLGVTPRGGDQ